MSIVFDALRLGAVALDVVAAAQATPQAIASRHKARLAALLGAALKGSALYRELLGGHAGTKMPLEALPVTNRHQLMQRFGDWVTDSRLELSQLRAFTADPANIAQPFLGKYLVWESSGTTGEPGIFIQDARAMAVYDALEALRRSTPRPLQRWFDPLLLAERIAFVGATDGHFASFVSMQRLRQLNPWSAQSLQCFSIVQPVAALVQQLNAFAPTIIATYPTAAALLADEAQRGSLRLGLQELWTGGETLTASVRRRVEQCLGCAVRNSYGASEFLTVGWECRAGNLHANTDWVILEPVDRHHRPVPAGVASASVLLTNLANYVQPLIRYDIGDQITIGAEPCACGSPLPVIEVRGRIDESLVMSAADGRSVTLLPLALTTVLEDEAGVFDFQLRQRDAHTLVLRLGFGGAAAMEAAPRCCAALQAFAARQGLPALRLLTELGQPIAMGRSGKVQRVVAAAKHGHASDPVRHRHASP